MPTRLVILVVEDYLSMNVETGLRFSPKGTPMLRGQER